MKNTISSFAQQTKSAEAFSADVQKDINTIKNLSQSEADKALKDEVARQKQNGSFDYARLLSQVQSLEAYMPEKDYKNLLRLLENLK